MSAKKAVAGLLNVQNVFCWSDSQISLWWIRLIRKDWNIWVENQVQVIWKNVASEQWMYVPISSLENIDMPCQNFLTPGEVSEEQKVETVLFVSSEKFFGIGEVMDNSQFRLLQKLSHVTSYVRRFVENLKVNLGKDRKVSSGEISAEEMDSSLKFWIKHEQLFLQRGTNFAKMKHFLLIF